MKLRKLNGLVLCQNCDTPASFSLSVEVGWIGCAPCILGESSFFDDGDLIPTDKRSIDYFLSEFQASVNRLSKEEPTHAQAKD